MVGRARTITEGTATPLIADADTGFGGLINVRQTVRGYEAAGVQAIQIEDQEMPKKCGHTPNRRVVPLADMCGDRGRGRLAAPRRHADHRAHRRAHRARPRRGDPARQGIRQGRRRHRLRRGAGERGRVQARRRRDRLPGCSPTWCPPASRPRSRGRELQAWGFDIAIYPSAGMCVVCAALEANYGLSEGARHRPTARRCPPTTWSSCTSWWAFPTSGRSRSGTSRRNVHEQQEGSRGRGCPDRGIT